MFSTLKYLLGTFVLSWMGLCLASAADEVHIAKEAKALLPIRLSEDADEQMVRLAGELAGYLHGITGYPFEVLHGVNGDGIVLGTREQFPQYLEEAGELQDPAWRERYRIVSEKGSVFIVGETYLAVQNGMFDFLYEIGHRHYFPGSNWEIIPRKPDLAVTVDRTVQPGFATRYLFYGTVNDEQMRSVFQIAARERLFNQWKRKNRAISGFNLHTYHNWHRIARRHPEAFKNNPHWISGVQNLPWEEADIKNWKFRVENPELRDLLRRDALQWFEDNPEATSYSIDPTDGGGWPTDSKIGTPSDQMVYLANQLIPYIQEASPEKKVAFYAYYMHSPPPTLTLKPGAIVSIATGFISGGYTVEQLMKGWGEKGAELGIREYVNVFAGSWDLPGTGYIGFNPEGHVERLRKFYADGARYWIAELDNAWAVIGLSTYIGMRTMWEPVNGESADEIIQEFLELCFGRAAQPLGRFYELVDSKNKPLVSSDLLARMYDALLEGLELENSPEVQRRIYELAVYVRFAELMHQFRNSAGAGQVEAFKQLGQWSIRHRNTQMFNPYGVFARIGLRDEKLTPVAQDYMKTLGEPADHDELYEIMSAQAGALQRITFSPGTYSKELRRVEAEPMLAQEYYELSQRKTLVWLSEKAGDELELTIRSMGGRVANPPEIVVSIMHHEDPLEQPADVATVRPDRQWHTIRLKSALPGVHHVSILDPSNYLEIKWPAGTPLVFPAGQELSSEPRSRNKPWSGWFYVPVGTEMIGGYTSSNQGQISDALGNVIYEFSELESSGYFEIPLSRTTQPHFLKLENIEGRRLLMTVPPYVARSPDELIVPEEVLSTNP